MIRKSDPKDPKGRAELIIREMASLGFTLPRGNALNLVAKLEGYRSWNEFSAASKQPAPLKVKVIVTRPGPAKYDNLSLYSGATGSFVDFVDAQTPDRISDVRLAVFLKHGRNTVTTLHEWVSPSGETYDLRLCGRARYVLTSGSGEVLEVCSSRGQSRDMRNILEGKIPEERLEIVDNPFFEWIDEAGDPIGDILEEIPVDVDEAESYIRSLVESRNL